MRWTLRRAVPDDAAVLGRMNVAAWQRVYRDLMPAALLDGLSRVDQTPNWRRTLALPEPHADFLAVRAAGPDDAEAASGGGSPAAHAADHRGAGQRAVGDQVVGGQGARGQGARDAVAGPAVDLGAGGSTELIGAYSTVGPPAEPADAHPIRRTGELIALYASPAWLRTGAGRLVHDAGLAYLAEAGYEHVVVWVMEGNSEGRAFYEAVGWDCDEVVRPLELPGFSLPEIRYSRPLPPPVDTPRAAAGR
ncbi:GNAT superfamily N-acetyltransferase [Actinoalloteichus hoggarensis]|nr:GNAT family N-acetyltransferase [Actinoalloteichus hoggarensis]MBB5919637.1 GNAT superfamily N-acetyltransferase [Actinoalloteichus hoggarensis]